MENEATTNQATEILSKVFFGIAVLYLLLIAPASVQAASVPPAPTEDGVWVIDAANVLSPSELDLLNTVCNDLYL